MSAHVLLGALVASFPQLSAPGGTGDSCGAACAGRLRQRLLDLAVHNAACLPDRRDPGRAA
jgi:hypothetical protein